MKKIMTSWALQRIALCSAILCFLCLSVSAQPWQPVDGDVINSGVHALAKWNDNLYIGGSFANPCNRIIEWDSLTYSCLGGGVGIVGRAAIEYNSELVVTGDFWNVQQPCLDCNGVAKWNGVDWQPMGTGFDNDVLALTHWNGNLVAAGGFNQADDQPCKSVAVWDGSGWSSVGGLTGAFEGQVRALAVYNDELWAGGDFTSVEGCPDCSRITKWNGSSWVNVEIPGGLADTVRVLHVDPIQNKLYMGGHFDEVAGDTLAKGVAVFDGASWSGLGSGVSGKGEYVRGITSYDGKIIVGGYYSHVNDTVNAKRVAAWDPVSLTWSPIGDGLKAGYVRALMEYKGELYAGGSFNESGDEIVNYIAKWTGPLIEVEIQGCTHPGASNYNPDAVSDDGSCILPGCTDSNFDNYNPLANYDDGTCADECFGDMDSNGVVNTADLLIFLTAFGTICP